MRGIHDKAIHHMTDMARTQCPVMEVRMRNSKDLRLKV